MNMIARMLALGAVALLAVSVSTASADPIRAAKVTTVNATCGQDTFTLVVMGNGAFTAAHDIKSTKVFVAVWFGVTSVWGNNQLLETFPASTKGSAAPKGHPLLDCRWRTPNEVIDGVTYYVSGTAKGFFA